MHLKLAVVTAAAASRTARNDMSNQDHPSKCAVCGSSRVAQIIYGFLDVNSIAAELDSGRAVLGGCGLSDSSCKWRCNTCQHEWGDHALEFGEYRRKNREARARRDAEAVTRGGMDAPLYPDGWVHCPYCNCSFGPLSWDGEKHKTCGTFLRLVSTE